MIVACSFEILVRHLPGLPDLFHRPCPMPLFDKLQSIPAIHVHHLTPVCVVCLPVCPYALLCVVYCCFPSVLCVCVWLCVCLCMCLSVCVCLCVCLSMYVYLCVSVRVCVYVTSCTPIVNRERYRWAKLSCFSQFSGVPQKFLRYTK